MIDGFDLFNIRRILGFIFGLLIVFSWFCSAREIGSCSKNKVRVGFDAGDALFSYAMWSELMVIIF